jgi:RecJ-like exonuclease
MKCECKRCKGDGVIEVTCDDCEGAGKITRCISQVDLEAIGRLDSADLACMERLQADAARCQDQAIRLTQMNPACAESYAEQLRATLAKLNQEADEFMKLI